MNRKLQIVVRFFFLIDYKVYFIISKYGSVCLNNKGRIQSFRKRSIAGSGSGINLFGSSTLLLTLVSVRLPASVAEVGRGSGWLGGGHHRPLLLHRALRLHVQVTRRAAESEDLRVGDPSILLSIRGSILPVLFTWTGTVSSIL